MNMEALPEQGKGEQKGGGEIQGTYEWWEDNPVHEEPTSSLSSMARSIRHTTKSHLLNLAVDLFCKHQ